MNAWILCADPLRAKIFFKKNVHSPATLYRTITRRKPRATASYVKYLAEEIDLACGAGTQSQLIVCGKRSLLDHLVARLSPEARSRLSHALPTP
jgi:hypothetical protein